MVIQFESFSDVITHLVKSGYRKIRLLPEDFVVDTFEVWNDNVLVAYYFSFNKRLMLLY